EHAAEAAGVDVLIIPVADSPRHGLVGGAGHAHRLDAVPVAGLDAILVAGFLDRLHDGLAARPAHGLADLLVAGLADRLAHRLVAVLVAGLADLLADLVAGHVAVLLVDRAAHRVVALLEAGHRHLLADRVRAVLPHRLVA